MILKLHGASDSRIFICGPAGEVSTCLKGSPNLPRRSASSSVSDCTATNMTSTEKATREKTQRRLPPLKVVGAGDTVSHCSSCPALPNDRQHVVKIVEITNTAHPTKQEITLEHNHLLPEVESAFSDTYVKKLQII